MAYDIFISYRRKGAGAGVAGELQTKLESRGYKVFLDVDNIGSGEFPQQIDNAIKGCDDFLMILSVGMLDRCAEEDDWVRHEIVLAEKYGKNILGASLPGFVMPEAHQLPEPLRKIPEIQVFLWSHEYRNASINKIVENLVSTKRKKQRSRRKLIAGVLGAVALAVGAILLIPKSKPEPEPIANTGTNTTMTTVTNNDVEPVVDNSQQLRDSYAQLVNAGDILLDEVPNPTTEEEFRKFMDALTNYENAVAISRTNPQLQLDSYGLAVKCDSLNDLRKERFNKEIEAASKFLSVDQVEFASYRYSNAKVLGREEDQLQLDAIARKMK